MDDRDWKILKTIAEEKNITRASEKLYISQPALSYRLKALEVEFRSQLFIRTPKGVTLTPQGEFLLSYANDMMLQLMKTKERLTSIGDKVYGPLRIGSSSVFANNILPELLRGFLELYPNVEIFLKTGRSLEINRLLEKEEVVVAIIRGDQSWSESKYLLFNDPICLVSNDPIPIALLPEKPRIIYQTDSTLQNVIDTWWRETFNRPSFISMVVDSMDTCKRMVSQGLGWSILPHITLYENDRLYIKELFWADGTPVIRPTWVCYPNYAIELPSVRAFVNYIKDYFKLKAGIG
ncbi:MAG: LysR family transcriptional regulator [Spirochaetes bacterium]|nr:LysR family transcriptional regulator [Spirochaetota bacterium]